MTTTATTPSPAPKSGGVRPTAPYIVPVRRWCAISEATDSPSSLGCPATDGWSWDSSNKEMRHGYLQTYVGSLTKNRKRWTRCSEEDHEYPQASRRGGGTACY